jgi:hypothetical protein
MRLGWSSALSEIVGDFDTHILEDEQLARE